MGKNKRLKQKIRQVLKEQELVLKGCHKRMLSVLRDASYHELKDALQYEQMELSEMKRGLE